MTTIQTWFQNRRSRCKDAASTIKRTRTFAPVVGKFIDEDSGQAGMAVDDDSQPPPLLPLDADESSLKKDTGTQPQRLQPSVYESPLPWPPPRPTAITDPDVARERAIIANSEILANHALFLRVFGMIAVRAACLETDPNRSSLQIHDS